MNHKSWPINISFLRLFLVFLSLPFISSDAHNKYLYAFLQCLMDSLI